MVHDGAAFAASLEVARVFGKQHNNVLAKIDVMVKQAAEASFNFKR